MVNLCSLLLKYNHFSKVEDDVFLYIDRILENAFEIYNRQKHLEKELARLDEELAQKKKRLPVSNVDDLRSPIKKRKVHSLDSSLMACKENAPVLDDSTIYAHKSDSDVSSKLEQNIIDSDEPFFALTQTPPSPTVPPLREIRSPSNEPSSKRATVRAVKLLFAEEINSSKQIIRDSRFGKQFKSLESSPVTGEKKAVVLTTPTVTPNGKWTGKKCRENLNTSKAENTPVALKRLHSLADSSTRFRQAKLNFPRQTKHSPANEPDHTEGDTLFSDFVVPTPPSVASKSKFLRSLRMKKQSTMVSKGQSDTTAAKESSIGTASSTTTTGEQCNPAAPPDDEDFDDINQTYCPGVESINRIANEVPVKIKQEPDSQREKRRPFNRSATKLSNCGTNLQRIESNEDSETNEVILLRPGSQQSIISVVESQHENDKFISELNDDRAKRASEVDCLGVNPALSNNVQRNLEFEGPSGDFNPFKRSFDQLREGLCNDCMKLYKFHTVRGVSNDAARSKLPRNCRSCRLAQLHSTPPGFWDPDFLPTPE